MTALPTPPQITNQPVSQSVSPGGSASFTVGSLGSLPLSFQWYVNGTLQPGATNTILQFTNLQPSLRTLFVIVTNAYGASTSAVASLVVNASTCTNAPSGLIAWWSGEGNAFDAVGTNHGQLQGGAGYGAGQVGQAFSVNGSSGFVQVPHNSAWGFGTNEFTIELWANFGDVSGSRAFLASDQGGGTQNKWIFWRDAGLLRFHINGTPGSVNIGSAVFTPIVGQWYHLAVTRKSTNYTFYINGNPVSTNTDSRLVPDANAPLTIGEAESGFFFNGLLDEISMYNRALSSSEIVAIYLASSYGKCPNLSNPPHFDTTPAGLMWTSGGLQLSVFASSPQRPTVVYASTNLSFWLPLITNPPTIGLFQFLDSDATNVPARFYRAGTSN